MQDGKLGGAIHAAGWGARVVEVGPGAAAANN